MKLPLSWIKEFVEIDLTLADLAHRITMAGMEVEAVTIIGLPMPIPGSLDAKVTGLEWDRLKIVVASITEVMPHPNADRLTLCKLFDGERDHVVLTGAPNLFEFKGKGPLDKPLKVAYAKEGAQIYDGHAEGLVLTTLKPAKIRGIDSYSMVCSEKELGISEEHEGILFLDDETVPGTPLVDVLGDAVIEVNLLPSFARCASVLGLAREISAITGKPLLKKNLSRELPAGEADFACIEINQPSLNPRFVLGLIRDVTIQPSPKKVQQRLKMAGMRPINNIVDATNYAMLELGQPLHAFDYDVLLQRAKGKPVKIITSTSREGETLKTLDGMERKLEKGTTLVCDEAGVLSIAGIMGGAESEVRANTRNILLEGAAWNMINIRKTARSQNLPSEASYRFSRGVHPAMAEKGVRLGLDLMQLWANGVVSPGLVDHYPLVASNPTVEITPMDVQRWLGIAISVEKIAELLSHLEFRVEIHDAQVKVVCPEHRLDISEGITGKADIIEEIARVYGYDNIPETRITDVLPPQRGNPALEKEERVRDLLTALSLQEIISYRWTTPENEKRRLAPDDAPDSLPYFKLVNPLAYERAFLRQSVLGSVLDAAERNSRIRERIALFEIGPVFWPSEGSDLPDEFRRLSIVLSGDRDLAGWQPTDLRPMDFFDLKGIITDLLEGLHLSDIRFELSHHPTFHPGKCARILIGEKEIGAFGELHPKVRAQYEFPATFKAPFLAADFNLDLLLELIPPLYQTRSIPIFPPVFEDLAFVIDEDVPAEKIADLIRQTGGKLLSEVKLFDIFHGEQIGTGKKSLAYNLTYISPDQTLTVQEVSGLRNKIIKRLEHDLGAKLRS
ncbi:MAG: phenylalanine--tRNA ligase subunit beta [Chloroflexi bacterium]|nr:phenylalanine--tRNA ligase subunit beta [Chloroflexota bacterium]